MRNDANETPLPTKKWSEMSAEERAALPEETRRRLYQSDYYGRTRVRRNAARKQRWAKDEKFKRGELDRMKGERAERRKETAPAKLADAIKAKQEAEAEKLAAGKRPTRRPRLVEIGGKSVLVHSTGAFAHALGRESVTVRAWLDEGVLPGCSIVIGGRCWYTEGFTLAVYKALEKLILIDARAPRDKLREFVRQELASAGEPFVPAPGRRKR